MSHYTCIVFIIFCSFGFSNFVMAEENEDKRARHKLYVPPPQTDSDKRQQVIPYQDIQSRGLVTAQSSPKSMVTEVTASAPEKAQYKRMAKPQGAMRFAIQLGFFKNKKSLWRFMKNKGLTGKDYHSVATGKGYVLLFGRYQTFEMANIVWEQLLFDYQDSFIVNL